MHVNEASWERDHAAIQSIRRTVFIEEQGVPEELEIDGMDPVCYHVLIFAPMDRPIGTARLARDGKIGRMAVLKSWRGEGAGSLMLQSLLAHAAEMGLESVYLHAQASAVPFYEKHGFEVEGKYFEEAGIRHVRMTRLLKEEVA